MKRALQCQHVASFNQGRDFSGPADPMIYSTACTHQRSVENTAPVQRAQFQSSAALPSPAALSFYPHRRGCICGTYLCLGGSQLTHPLPVWLAEVQRLFELAGSTGDVFRWKGRGNLLGPIQLCQEQ